MKKRFHQFCVFMLPVFFVAVIITAPAKADAQAGRHLLLRGNGSGGDYSNAYPSATTHRYLASWYFWWMKYFI